MSRDSAIHDLNLRVLGSIQNTVGVFKGVVKAADEYQKAMKNAALKGAKMAVALNTVSQQAASAKSTTHDLGVGVHEVAEAQRQLQRCNHTVSTEVNKICGNVSGFLNTYELEVKDWKRNYLSKCKQMEKNIKDAEKKSKEKSVKKNQESLLKAMNEIAENIKAYEIMRQDALRETLIFERKRYCFLLNQFSSVMKLENGFCDQNHRHLDSKLGDWVRLGSIPKVLPPEAEELVKNPKRTLVALGENWDNSGGIYDDFSADLDWAYEGTTGSVSGSRPQMNNTGSRRESMALPSSKSILGDGKGSAPSRPSSVAPPRGNASNTASPIMKHRSLSQPSHSQPSQPSPGGFLPGMDGGVMSPGLSSSSGGVFGSQAAVVEEVSDEMGDGDVAAFNGGESVAADGPTEGTQYQALWDYAPEDPNGLHFREHDIIIVNAPAEDGWLYGECNGKEGWFPENYACQ